MDLWKKLAASDKTVVMYGMGNGADKILAVCERYGIVVADFFASDGFVRGQKFHDKTVLSFSAIKEKYGMEYSEETIAIVALLHDLCKINFYTVEYRNRKNDAGVWEKYPCYTINDTLPYGHGEKSVYIISGFFYGDSRLSREEAFAIRYHMGFSGSEEKGNVGKAFEMFPLAFALSTADMEATYFLE